MRHHILVKWADDGLPRPETPPIRELFLETLRIPGIHDVSVQENIVQRPNRYDLLIIIAMEKEALDAYDASEPHQRWKAVYSSRIAQKAIFDCE